MSGPLAKSLKRKKASADVPIGAADAPAALVDEVKLKKKKKKDGPPTPEPEVPQAAPAKKQKKATMAITTVVPSPGASVDDDAPSSKKNKNKKQSPPSGTQQLTSEPEPPRPSGSGGSSSGTLDAAQIGRAARALLKHIEVERRGLLDDSEPPINVMMATKRAPKAVGKATACKPVPVRLPHPFVSLETAEICVITKDPQREYKDKLTACGLKVGANIKVIGVEKLKKKYKEYESKRNLRKAHHVFLADARVLPMLPPLLGKTFFVKRRLPAAVDLTKADLRAEIERVACGTFFRYSSGTSTCFQVGTAAQPAEQLVENVVAAVEQVVSRTPGKWTNLQSLMLRTTNSVSLPFFNANIV